VTTSAYAERDASDQIGFTPSGRMTRVELATRIISGVLALGAVVGGVTMTARSSHHHAPKVDCSAKHANITIRACYH
jgi:hypothetical protein